MRLLSPNILFLSIYHFMALLACIVSPNFEFDKSGIKMPGYNSIIPFFLKFPDTSQPGVYYIIVGLHVLLCCLWILEANTKVKKYAQTNYKKLERKGNLCCSCVYVYVCVCGSTQVYCSFSFLWFYINQVQIVTEYLC